jgi:hypothetical protein
MLTEAIAQPVEKRTNIIKAYKTKDREQWHKAPCLFELEIEAYN